MLGKFVAGMPQIHRHHDPVARDFGDDARRGDAEAAPVTADERGLRDGKGEHRPPVDQDVIRRERQRGHGAAHRLVGGAQDVQPVDFRVLHDGQRPADCSVADEFLEEPLALLRRQLLRIIELPVTKTLRQHHDRGDHRPGQRSAPSLINPGHALATEGAQRAFVPEIAFHRQTGGG